MIETKAIIYRSIFLYELENIMAKTKIVTNTAPTFMGTWKSIFNAIAPPSISAKDVDIDAAIADHRTTLDPVRGKYLLAASDKQSPVTMPKCATLCCNNISITVDSDTTHNKV